MSAIPPASTGTPPPQAPQAYGTTTAQSYGTPQAQSYGTPAKSTSSSPYSKHNLQLPYIDNNLNDLLLWRDPKKTGAVLGGLTLVYGLLQWSGWSAIAIVSYALLVTVVVSLVWAQAGGFINKQGPPVPTILMQGFVDDAQWKRLSETVRVYVNKALSLAGTLLSGGNPKVSLQAAGALYGLAQLASRVSIVSTTFTLVVLAFIIPKVYELRKDDIDQRVNYVANRGKEAYRKVDQAVLQKIPQAQRAKVQ